MEFEICILEGSRKQRINFRRIKIAKCMRFEKCGLFMRFHYGTAHTRSMIIPFITIDVTYI